MPVIPTRWEYMQAGLAMHFGLDPKYVVDAYVTSDGYEEDDVVTVKLEVERTMSLKDFNELVEKSRP